MSAQQVKGTLLLKKWINIKAEFADFYKVSKMSMIDMLKFLDIKLEGRHHSGIDDCCNTAKIWQRMINDGYKIQKESINVL